MKPSPGIPDRSTAARLPGVDLMRGFGALGVICVHVGIVVNNRISPGGAALQAWFDFVVAFFLVTALFFCAAEWKHEACALGPLAAPAL